MSELPETVVQRQGEVWQPSQFAAGPFGGLHGGVIAACLLTAMAEQAPVDTEPAVVNVQLLRAPAQEPFTITAGEIRSGRRSATFEARLDQNGKEMARASAIFVRGAPVAGVDLPALTPFDPQGLPPPEARRVGSGPWSLGQEWFWGVFDVGVDDEGGFWFRPRIPVLAGAIPAATVVAIADWSSGLFRPDRMGPQRFAAWPNAELSVHLARPGPEIDPSGWFGVSGASAWNAFAWGYTGATLRDPAKLLARSAQACILTPAENGP